MNQIEFIQYMQNKARQKHSLFQLEIDVTSKCNAKCPFCFQGDHSMETDDSISYSKMIELLDDLRKMGVYYIGFSGGEPFLRKDFIKILEAAKERGFRVSIITNGMALNKELIDRMHEIKLEHITVSFHSISREIYEKSFGLNGGTGYEKAIENIRHMLDVGLNVGIAITVTRYNIETIPQTKDYFVKMGIDPRDINYNMLLRGKQEINSLYPEEENIAAVKNIISVKAKGKEYRKGLLCSAGSISCTIDYKGNVYPCSFFNASAGNINDQSIEQIWNESHLFKIIRGLREDMFKECNKCSIMGKCSFCMANNLNQTGNLFEPDKEFCGSRKAKEAI
ncbi:MAG: radical SAM protein [Lachnospiraceae bacterium]|nr:radical SAM protein [Lachnospiraceae bacterium]